jgi:hypothetical protein
MTPTDLNALSRDALRGHPDAANCTLYRPDPGDPEEELDLGDGKVLIGAPFEPPQAWDAAEREAFFGDLAPERFVLARIVLDDAATEPVPGDVLAVSLANSDVQTYFVEDRQDQLYVLLRDEFDD